MKELKDLMNKENVEKVKDAAGKIAEAIPEEMLDKISGAGNPFENIPRIPTQPIDEDLRRDG